MQAHRVSGGGAQLSHTPVSHTLAGTVVVVNNLVGVVISDIAANHKGAIEVEGTWSFVKQAEALTQGTEVYWHPTGDPVGGVADSGAVTGVSTGAVFLGFVVEDAATNDQRVHVARALPSPAPV